MAKEDFSKEISLEVSPECYKGASHAKCATSAKVLRQEKMWHLQRSKMAQVIGAH